MATMSDVRSIIVPAQSANLSAHTYTEVYGGSAGCSMILNGVAVSIGAASSIFVRVASISGGTGCFLLGENQNVYLGSQNLY